MLASLALLLAACAFRVPPPAAGEAAPLPLAVHPEDHDRPYVEWDGRLWFVDTGASRTTCDDELVEELGLKARRSPFWRSRGEVGVVKLGRAVMRDVEVGGWRFSRLPCAVRDLATTSSIPGEPHVAGVLGANLLRHFAVALDRDAGTLGLHPSAGEDGGAPLRRERGTGPRLVATLELDGVPVRAVVDTGADRLYLDTEVGEVVRRWDSVRQGTGPGGEIATEVVLRRVGQVRLHGEPLPVDRYVERRGRVGLLGMEAFAGRSRVVVDFPGRRLRVEPGWSEADVVDVVQGGGEAGGTAPAAGRPEGTSGEAP